LLSTSFPAPKKSSVSSFSKIRPERQEAQGNPEKDYKYSEIRKLRIFHGFILSNFIGAKSII